MKRLAFILLPTLLLLTGCSSGGLSSANQNAFVSGDGVAVYVKPADRKPAPIISGATLNSGTTTLIIDAHGYVAARVSGEVTVALLTDLLTKVLKDPAHA